MYFRISAIDDRPLPTGLAVMERTLTITGGGLLMMPSARGPVDERSGVAIMLLTYESPGQSTPQTFTRASTVYRIDRESRVVLGDSNDDAIGVGRLDGDLLVVQLFARMHVFSDVTLRLEQAPQDAIGGEWLNAMETSPGGFGISAPGLPDWTVAVLQTVMLAGLRAWRVVTGGRRRIVSGRTVREAWRAAV